MDIRRSLLEQHCLDVHGEKFTAAGIIAEHNILPLEDEPCKSLRSFVAAGFLRRCTLTTKHEQYCVFKVPVVGRDSFVTLFINHTDDDGRSIQRSSNSGGSDYMQTTFELPSSLDFVMYGPDWKYTREVDINGKQSLPQVAFGVQKIKTDLINRKGEAVTYDKTHRLVVRHTINKHRLVPGSSPNPRTYTYGTLEITFERLTAHLLPTL